MYQPPQSQLAPARAPRRLWIGALVAATLAVAIGIVGVLAATRFIQRQPNVERMLPASVDAYALIYLQPSVGQRLNLLSLSRKFPKLATETDARKAVNDLLGKALPGAGVGYDSDIAPWLGSQAAIAIKDSAQPPLLVLVDSKDDSRAAAFLAKARRSKSLVNYAWTTVTYQGASISSGRSPDARDPQVFYAVANSTVVLSSRLDLLEQSLDAGAGRAARIVDSADNKMVASHMPTDRLVFVFIDGRPLSALAKHQLATAGSLIPTGGTASAAGLDAFRAAGFDVVAQTSGLQTDLDIETDASKLDPALRSALSGPVTPIHVTAWIPDRALGFIAMGSFKQTVQALVAAVVKASPSTAQSLEAAGVTGPNGIVNHLGDDFGLEVSPGSRLPSGAILLGTDDPTAMDAFLARLAALGTLAGSSTNGPGASAQLVHTVYRGVTITYVSPAPSADFAPAYAVTGGYGMIAATRDELQRVIDAHLTGQIVTKTARYRAATWNALNPSRAILYIDVDSSLRTARGLIPDAQRGAFDSTAAELAPIKALAVTSEGGVDRRQEVIFALIE